MTSTTASKTIEKIRAEFAAYGSWKTLVSDDGPEPTSAQFADFLWPNGVKHIRISLYHAASNGAAERMLQTIERALLKQVLKENASKSRSSFHERIDKFLCVSRNTFSSVTGQLLAQLFLKRRPRTKLYLVKPAFGQAMWEKLETEPGRVNTHTLSSEVSLAGLFDEFSGNTWDIICLNEARRTGEANTVLTNGHILSYRGLPDKRKFRVGP